MTIVATVNVSVSSTTLTINSVLSGAVAANTFLYGTGVSTNCVIVSGSGSSWVISAPQNALTNISASVASLGATDYGITGLSTTNNSGSFSCNSTTLKVGMIFTIYGALSGISWTNYGSGATYIVIATNGSTTFTLGTMSGGGLVTTTGAVSGLTFTLIGNQNSANNITEFKSRSTVFKPSLSVIDKTTYALNRRAYSFGYANTTANNIFKSSSTVFKPSLSVIDKTTYTSTRILNSYNYANTTANNRFKSRSNVGPSVGRIITANSTTANSLITANGVYVGANNPVSNSANTSYKSRLPAFRKYTFSTDKTIYANSSILIDSYYGSMSNTVNLNIFKYKVSSPSRKSIITTYAATSGNSSAIGSGGTGPTQIWTTGT